jgi:hypothetical protein
MFSFLRNWTSGKTPSHRNHGRPVRASRRASFKPALESLEQRQLLSAASTNPFSVVYNNAQWGVTLNADNTESLVEFLPNGTEAVSPVHLQGTIQKVSAGKWSGGSGDAAYVLDSSGRVWEFWRSGSTIYSGFLPMCSNAHDISASAVSNETVFVAANDGTVAEYQVNAWNLVIKTQLGAPFSGPTWVSAALDGATGNPAVFANFNGALCEHTGAGWSYVAGWTRYQPYPGSPPPVTDFSASQLLGDTVFAVINGGLVEGIGKATGANKPLSYTWSTVVSSGVAQVSVGYHYGQPTAFVLDTSGSVAEYTFSSGNWSKKVIFTAQSSYYATSIEASQVQDDTVYYYVQCIC